MRKEIDYTATKGRDKGKVYHITEMSAADAEDWALRVVFALMNTGIDIPDDLAEMGFAGIVSLGLKALGQIPYEMAKPILADMMLCVKAVPDPSKPHVVRALVDSDIEEVSTRIMLRKEVFELHASALKDGAP